MISQISSIMLKILGETLPSKQQWSSRRAPQRLKLPLTMKE
jgi:hypothetical protein